MAYKRVRAGLETSLKVARAEGALTDKHAATIAAARALADKVDTGAPNDNVSASVYLKHLEALGLTASATDKGKDSGQEVSPKANALALLQAQVQARQAAWDKQATSRAS